MSRQRSRASKAVLIAAVLSLTARVCRANVGAAPVNVVQPSGAEAYSSGAIYGNLGQVASLVTPWLPGYMIAYHLADMTNQLAHQVSLAALELAQHHGINAVGIMTDLGYVAEQARDLGRQVLAATLAPQSPLAAAATLAAPAAPAGSWPRPPGPGRGARGPSGGSPMSSPPVLEPQSGQAPGVVARFSHVFRRPSGDAVSDRAPWDTIRQ